MTPHGSEKKPEQDDPYELVGNTVPGGDTTLMAECLVEEFALLGWEKPDITRMFYNPFYQAAHLYYQTHGKTAVQHLVDRVLARCGVVRVQIVEAPVELNPEEKSDHA
jgi:hypothetical protein